ncbi:hypothetical protein ACJMK2_009165 [Sinanodonta woodiana]|uniref:Chromo domain-containing protein n=1 Tax=Sinanodonta woodiana TaxID=1069815 RepID=A0ABD3VCZ3_SINWO
MSSTGCHAADKLHHNDKRPRTVFTDDQLKGLESSWDSGLYNTRDKASVSTLADNLALTEQQVKDWIGNKRAKLKRSSNVTQTLIATKAPVMKGPTAYNLFCKGKSLVVKEQQMWTIHLQAVHFRNGQKIGKKWKKERSKNIRKMPFLCDILGSLGIHVGGLFVDTDGCTGVFGSNNAHGFFLQSGIRENFESQMRESQSHREADLDHRNAVNLVRKTFNDCWEKATGKRQVPYKAIKKKQYRLEVKNLPSGIKFRDPSCMGLKTLKSIMSVKDLEIIVLSQPSNTPVLGNDGGPTETDGPEKLENEVTIPSLSGPTETAVSDTESMIPSLSKDDVDILLGDVGSRKLPETNEVSVEPSSSKIYAVEKILQRRKRGKRRELLIKWKNFDKPTWEPEKNLVS